MKHKVLLPAAACAATPLIAAFFWVAGAPGGLLSGSLSGPEPRAQEPVPLAPSHGEVPGNGAGRARLTLVPLASSTRTAIGSLASGSLAPGSLASGSAATGFKGPGAPATPGAPTELRLSEVGSEVAARLNSRLALFDEPTDTKFAAWYAGSSLEELARVHFDGAVAASGLEMLDRSAPVGGSDLERYGLGSLAHRRGSFEKEVTWLEGELARRTERSGNTSALAVQSDKALLRRFQGPRGLYALRTVLMQEAHAMSREAASQEFAKVRSLSAKDRVEHAFPFFL